jgi:HlyD family secretion protein
MFTKYLLPLVALGLIVFAVMHVGRASKNEEPMKPPVEPSRNPFTDTVAGAGMVEAQTENIAIGSPDAGVIVTVFVEVGQRVQAGDKLFQLDDRLLRADLKYREAAAAAAEAHLTHLERQPRPEEVPAAEAQVAEMEANLLARRDALDRSRRLARTKVVTEEDLVAREQEVRVAEAQVRRMSAQLDLLKAGAWQYDKLEAQATLEETLAQVDQVKAQLERLTVCALVDGQVLQVNVRPGEFVATPANQALVILGNVDLMHVRVDIDEHDIHRFQPNAPAMAGLRGDPDHRFPLRFMRVEPYVIPKRSLTGDNTERVDTRVLQVIYKVDSPDERLYVGQQLDVYIDLSKPAGKTHSASDRIEPRS